MKGWIMIAELSPQRTLTLQQALDMAEVLARNYFQGDTYAQRLSCAVALVKHGQVLETDTPHTWSVASTTRPGTEHRVDGTCDCEDAQYRAPNGYCKHVIAVLLARKVLKLMQTPVPDLEASTVSADEAAPTPVLDADGWPPEETLTADAEPLGAKKRQVPKRFLQTIHGTRCITFIGLLQMAHEDGLVELRERWTHNAENLSLAHAVAIFADGRRFEGCGDSTQESGARVGMHWRRLALTRGKARALRDALGIDACSVEEME
jgi:hypothetical protein